jgi:hypothetical protein
VGLIVPLTPPGKLPIVKVTAPAKPFTDPTLIVLNAVGLVDLFTVSVAGLELRVNEPPGVTVKLMSVE